MKKYLFSAAVMTLLVLCLCFAVSCVPTGGGSCGSHDYDHEYGETVVLVAATCTEAGSGKRVCLKCGHEKTGLVIPATGHDYGKAEVTVAPTCTSKGTQVRICKTCGNEETSTLSETAHNLGAPETVREATCQQEGETVRRCSDCDYTETGTLPKVSHRYEETGRLEATCEEIGQITRTCPMCGAEKTEIIDRLGHSYVSPPEYTFDYLDHANPNYCYHRYQHCLRCDKDIRTGVKSHRMSKDADRSVDATCVSAGLAAEMCLLCEYRPDPVEIPIDPSRHTKIIEKMNERDAETCTQLHYGECESCHAVTWEHEYAAHDYDDMTLECRRTGCGAVYNAHSSWFEYSFFNDGFAIKKLTNTAAFATYLAATGGRVRLPSTGTRVVGGITQTYDIKVIAGDLFSALDADIAATVTYLYVPDGYAQVNAYAFRGLTSLTGLYLPASITEMKTRSLEGCVALTTLTMPHAFHTELESLFGVPVSGGNTSVLTTLKLHRGTGTKVALASEKLLSFALLERVELATGMVGGITYTLDDVTFTQSKTLFRNGTDATDGSIEFALVYRVD